MYLYINDNGRLFQHGCQMHEKTCTLIDVQERETISSRGHRRRLWGQPGNVSLGGPPPIIEKRLLFISYCHTFPPSNILFCPKIFLTSLRKCWWQVLRMLRPITWLVVNRKREPRVPLYTLGSHRPTMVLMTDLESLRVSLHEKVRRSRVSRHSAKGPHHVADPGTLLEGEGPI